MIHPPKHIEEAVLDDDGTFPNSTLPVLIYRNVVEAGDAADELENAFAFNGWTGAWRNGVYSYHHYHSTTHEVLGVSRGSASLRLGGENGRTFDVNEGDVIVIPAGVAHKSLGSSGSFQVVGAYPDGRSFDMNYGKGGERPAVDENIREVPLPKADPLYGPDGPLLERWTDP